MPPRAIFRHAGALALAALLTGCGVSPTATQVKVTSNHITGSVHGGQQPVSGATIQLYTVNTSTTGGPSTPLIASTVTSGPDGSFDITTAYTCTNATLVYLTATGGNPGLSSNNPNLALMATLGNCADLNAGTFVNLNELTTVAAVYALAPYMTSLTAVGSPSSSSLTAAFSLANQFVNVASGTAPGTNIPTGDTDPTALINILGNIVATCINSSGGNATDTSTPCGSLFSLTTPPATPAPTDTVQALLDLALNPTLSTQALFNLAPAASVFQPTLTQAPPDFRLRLLIPTTQQALQFSVASLTLPSTAVSVTSASSPVTITNSTSSAISSLALTITGTNAADFAVTGNCGTTLAANSSCTAQIITTPTATGTRNAYLAITSSAPDSPQYIALSVSAFTGTPQATFDVYSYQLANDGFTHDFTLSNVGTGPLLIYGFSTYTSFFPISSNCGSSLAPGSNCTVSMLVHGPGASDFPFTNGFLDYLALNSNDPSFSAGVLLMASGSAGLLTYSTSNIVFPPTAVDSSSTVQFSAPSSNCLTFPVSTSTIKLTSAASGTSPNLVTCTYTLTFTPTATGTINAKLGTATNYMPIVATAIPAPYTNITLSPSVLYLTNNTAGAVTVTNNTVNPVNIQSISVGTGFTQTNNCGTSLFGQSVCTITVTSTATLPGGAMASLTLNDDAGTQMSAVAASEATTLDFGPAAIGVKSLITYTAHAYAVQNDYAAFTSASTTSSGDFAGSTCSTARADCLAALTFTPTATGNRTGTSTFKTASTSSTSSTNTSFSTTYLVKGTGVAAGPSVTIRPLDINVVKAAVGASSSLGSTTIANTGSTGLKLTSSFTGPNASEFSFYFNCASPLMPGQTCLATLQILPTQLGPRYATLVLTDSISGQTFTLPVEGIGLFGLPSTKPVSYNFPATHLNVTSSIPITITSPALHPVTFTASNSSITLSNSSCAQGQNPCSLTVYSTPTTAGNSFYTITIIDTFTGSQGTAYIGATGGLATASVSPNAITYGARPVGSTSISQTITLTNSGDAALSPLFATSGANRSDFIITNNCSSTLAVNSSCTLTASFAPTASGTRSASINITSAYGNNDGSGLPLTVTLTGTAQ